mmetsp:Transcript_144454/g.254735  ORF Transcript_144454/g.254735 Transcript_144454/m.254735 type:complete len:792 (-) Transcript_144454:86-2461(-)
MASKMATASLLALMFTMAMGVHDGNKTFGQSLPEKPVTKYIHSVPIYNYQWFHKHAKTSTMNEKDTTPYTTWLIAVHDKADKKMRDFCAVTEMGKRHCIWVLESMSSFHFNGTEDELALFLNVHNWMVEFVEPDSEMHIARGIHDLPGVEQDDPAWGIDRIDQRSCIGGSYKPGLKGGWAKGIHVFILDTGIRISHHDFEGRAVAAFDATSGRVQTCNPYDTNCAADRKSGHGSHCAGIVGGKTYGAAKKVLLYAGKVLSDEGRGGLSGIIGGIDYVVKYGKRPVIASMSLGAPGNSNYYKRAIDVAVSKGVVVTVAAGNEHSNACNFQPAFVQSAITVGSTVNPMKYKGCVDVVSYFSNYGPCVDIFAPGSDITSVGRSCDTCKAVMSGTSMACPLVAGAAAIVLTAYPGADANKVKALLKQHSSKIRTLPGGENGYQKPDSTPDLLYIGAQWKVGGPTPTPTPRSRRRRTPAPKPTPTPTPPGQCADRNSNCPQWAAKGFCATKATSMFLVCPKSCYACSAKRVCNPSIYTGLTCIDGTTCAAGDWGCCGAKSKRAFCPAVGKQTKMCTGGACGTPNYKCQAVFGPTPCFQMCNPSTCFGLTCTNGKCCSPGDWDCCGTGKAKYLNRKYCPTFGSNLIMCWDGACVNELSVCIDHGPAALHGEPCGGKASSVNSSSFVVKDQYMTTRQAEIQSAVEVQQALRGQFAYEGLLDEPSADEGLEGPSADGGLDEPSADGGQSAAEEQPVREASANGQLLQVSVGIIAVAGIIMGVKWHKSAAREIKVKPYLG